MSPVPPALNDPPIPSLTSCPPIVPLSPPQVTAESGGGRTITAMVLSEKPPEEGGPPPSPPPDAPYPEDVLLNRLFLPEGGCRGSPKKVGWEGLWAKGRGALWGLGGTRGDPQTLWEPLFWGGGAGGGGGVVIPSP